MFVRSSLRHLSKGFVMASDKQTKLPFSPRNANQRKLISAVEDSFITFAKGPAGVGKSMIAMRLALLALKERQVGRIVLCRPVLECGEKIGFLPGTKDEKMKEHMDALMDACIDDGIEESRFDDMLAKGTIKIAVIGHSRGSNFRNDFVVVDEAQNCTKTQLKMLLTRFGEGSKMVVCMDETQIDLVPTNKSCCSMIDKLRNVPGLSIVEFGQKDIVRHKIVEDILLALDGPSPPMAID